METQTETTGSEITTTVEEPKVLTLAEVEKQYHESFDKSRGRDMEKLYPGQVKKEEANTVEAKTVETKVETPKTEEPKQPTKADRDLGKLRSR